jgi:hypothetical protein
LPELKRMNSPFILRGSHPNDYHGFIDICPTIRDAGIFYLEKEIKKLEDRFRNPDFVGDFIKNECKDWNQPYSQEIHKLIQEQSPSPIVGSMIRHPHDRKQLRIQYLDISDTFPFRDAVSHACVNIYGEFRHSSSKDKEIKELIQMYEILESSDIVDKEWSQQMEFGLRPLFFYQARPFKKFQPAECFEIPYSNELKCPNLSSRECFGITPKEGIDVSFFIDLNIYYINADKSRPYGIIYTTKLRRNTQKERLGNLIVFCSTNCDWNYLQHGTYRFIKKADISFIDILHWNLGDEQLWERDLSEFKESRVFCNGLRGIIIPQKYL